jgi:hypothetical protein
VFSGNYIREIFVDTNSFCKRGVHIVINANLGLHQSIHLLQSFVHHFMFFMNEFSLLGYWALLFSVLFGRIDPVSSR